MYRIWQMVHPTRLLIAMYAFLGILAFVIHFILLSTERYNWLAGPATKTSELHAPGPVVHDLGKVRIG